MQARLAGRGRDQGRAGVADLQARQRVSDGEATGAEQGEAQNEVHKAVLQVEKNALVRAALPEGERGSGEDKGIQGRLSAY